MEQLIIQFSGWKGSGKDTLADYLVERLPSVKKYSYAGLLKTAFCEKFNIDFENLEIYKRDEKLFFDSIKDYYPELKNPNVRMGLIEYSCELKDKFGSDYFIEVVAQQIKENSDIRVHLITDCRFKQEFDRFKDALLLRIERKVCASDLPMENLLNNEKFDLYLSNNTTLLDYQKECEYVYELIK